METKEGHWVETLPPGSFWCGEIARRSRERDGDFSHSNESSFETMLLKHNLTGWRKPIGCLKLQVIFRERATNYRALLREMTCKDKASYDSTPPCTQQCNDFCLSFFLLISTAHSQGNINIQKHDRLVWKQKNKMFYFYNTCARTLVAYMYNGTCVCARA